MIRSYDETTGKMQYHDKLRRSKQRQEEIIKNRFLQTINGAEIDAYINELASTDDQMNQRRMID